ncbi:MAG: helix-turn-helix domain-containing protein, partial [Chloroflexota bacterium]
MTKRSYHQYCPIAYSLDVIGERWTLLIIRELIMGPRRFTDLLQTLDGIGPHLLSKRLKHLREHEMIVQEKLP